MTDSYHFQIEPESRAEVPKFRVGGHYRQNNGAVVKLLEFKPGLALAERVFPPPGSWLNSGGARRLSDGIYPGALRNAAYECHLIPGELIERDGQWVDADSIGPFGSGATLKTSGDKIVGREPYRGSSGVTVTVAGGTSYSKPTEPIRPALDWNTATPFDTFGADFIVTKGAEPTSPLYDSPTTDSAYPAIAGLLRG